MANKDIIQELNDLGSNLATLAQNIYSVPEGYFEGFATEVINRIKAEEAGLEYLSSIPKENPYQVPVGYFGVLAENIMKKIRKHADYQTSKEELESISPLLSSLNKKPVYSVPEDYFENFEVTVKSKPETKLISITYRRWLRYAAAAMVIGIITVGSILINNINSRNKINPNDNPQGWVNKNVIKKVSPEVINEFVKLTDEELSMKEGIVTNNKPDDIRELMKDVPVNEIDKFLNETGASEETETDALMN